MPRIVGRNYEGNPNYQLVTSDCYRCMGSGRFHWSTSYGPQSGPCYGCDGVGRVSRYQPTEEHAKTLEAKREKRAAKRRAKFEAERAAKASERATRIEANPWTFGAALAIAALGDSSLADCLESFLDSGKLSLSASYRLWRAGLRVADASQARPVVSGRGPIAGRVLSVKFTETDWGSSVKMLVRDDRGFKLFGTIPNSLLEAAWQIPQDPNRQGAERLIGERITMTATVEASRDDQSFGFYKRPTKAKIA